MKKVIISENQRGFLFRNGKLVKFLEAGKYYTYGDREIEVVSVQGGLHSDKCTIDVLMACPGVKESAAYVEVPEQSLAFHFVNGRFTGALPGGIYAYWNLSEKHEFQIVSTAETEVSKDVPEYILSRLPEIFCKRVEIFEYEKGRLMLNGRLEKILEPGVYYFWQNNVSESVSKIDTRLMQMDISGQEIMTADKVSLRINFVCSYKVTDYVKSFTEVDDFREQIHIAAQLALRDYVGRYRLDDILNSKEEMSKYVLARLKEKEESLFVRIFDAGVKDIILPGEIREIMNTVLLAEKRAQANVITRREEVASTRSLLNTAKMMEENETLYKLKELEYIERICENVGNISLNGSGDILAQLTAVLGKH